jgi:hypothetical protein
VIATGGVGAFGVTVMIATSFCIVSCTDIAVTTAVPGATPVTRPPAVTVATPGVAERYVTAVFVAPVTIETSCSDWPTASEAASGFTETVTGPVFVPVTTTWPEARFVPSCADVAMIVVVPGATAVTTPVVALTVATLGVEDENVTARFVVSLPPATAALYVKD